MSCEKTIHERLASEICDELPEGVTTIFIGLNSGFSWLDFEDLCDAMLTIRPHVKLTPFVPALD